MTATVRYLSAADVRACGVAMPEVIGLVENALRRQHAGETLMPVKSALAWRDGSCLWAMPGFVAGERAVGLKWVGAVGSNPARGLPQTFAVIVLGDVETGLPVAFMDGTWITNMRTGAVSAVAARLLVSDAQAPLALIGCGAQMRTQVMALSAVLRPQDVRVHARGREGAERFIAEVRDHFDAPWRYCATAEQAVRGAGVIVTATRLYHPPLPIVRAAWLEAGSLSLPIDIQGAFEPGVYRRLDKFVCDQWEPLLKMAGADGFPEGLPTLHGELHDVLCGAKAGRTSAGERIMAMNTGMAIEDVVVANAVLAAAERRDLGVQLPL